MKQSINQSITDNQSLLSVILILNLLTNCKNPINPLFSSCPSTENVQTSANQQHLRGTEMAGLTSLNTRMKSTSDMWLSNVSSSATVPLKKLQEPLVGVVTGKTNGLQNKFK